MKSIYACLSTKLEKKESLVLATIIETKGSSPQVPGASALFSSQGLVAGTLGGGWLEADAQKKAVEALKNKETLLCEFHLTADISADEGAICGGEIRIVIDARPEKHRYLFSNIIQSPGKWNRGVLATFIQRSSGEEVELSRYWIDRDDESSSDTGEPISSFQKEIDNAFRSGKPHLLKIGPEKSVADIKESLLFLEPIRSPSQLVIAGAGHIGQALTRLGSMLNFEVTVIDDRPEFANKEKLPDADHIIAGNMGKILENYPISPDTFIVIVTHGHKHDAEALRQVIASEAAYIGMIGSVRKVALTRKSFLEQGWATTDQFDRVYAPIGVDIHSETVEEIALSIAAQLVLVRGEGRNKPRDPL